MITDGKARRIASEWHSGLSSALYKFTSTGAIVLGLWHDIADCQADAYVHRSHYTDQDRADLAALYSYADSAGERGPQCGWAELWESP